MRQVGRSARFKPPFLAPPPPLDTCFVLVDEETGQDRFMRGLAKMRELDLRLARTTERARELKLMAQDAAERAAAGIFTTTGNEVQKGFRRNRTNFLRWGVFTCSLDGLIHKT